VLSISVGPLASIGCVDLCEAIIKLRPDWASAKDDDAEAEKGKACVVKVIMVA
jgi:type I restriction enzyme R subunit